MVLSPSPYLPMGFLSLALWMHRSSSMSLLILGEYLVLLTCYFLVMSQSPLEFLLTLLCVTASASSLMLSIMLRSIRQGGKSSSSFLC